MKQKKFEWRNIDFILPNPKNPRKDPSVKTQEMQAIIKKRGWEEGITAYKRGNFCIIMSGHRRWFAAKQIGIKELPVFYVPEPKSDLEELERLGSIQSGQEDWSPYEWIEHTYNIYTKRKDNINYSNLAMELNVTTLVIAARIRVYAFYPRQLIESKLDNGMYSLTMLDYIRKWIEKVKKHHSRLISSLGGERTIINSMLKKLENKCFTSDIANNQYVKRATEKEIVLFLSDFNLKLDDWVDMVEFRGKNKSKTVSMDNIKKINLVRKDLSSIKFQTKQDAIKIEKALGELENQVLATLANLRNQKRVY